MTIIISHTPYYKLQGETVMSCKLRTLAILFLSVLLSSCDSAPAIPHDPILAYLDRPSTHDPATQYKRFGVLTSLVSQSYVPVMRSYEWLRPGSILIEKHGAETYHFVYEETFHELRRYRGEQYDIANVRDDGSIFVTGSSPEEISMQGDQLLVRVGDKVYLGTADEKTYMQFLESRRAQTAMLESEARVRNREEQAESDRRMAAAFGAFAGTLQSELAKNSGATLPLRAQNMVASGTSSAREHPPKGTISLIAENQQKQIQAPTVDLQKSAQGSRSNDNVTSGVSNRGNKTLGSPKRMFYEAVTVCTKPSGPKSSFECRSPLNVQRGHAGDISGHRTPEQLASGEACPGMRRLVSSTHLVWGCGFAATGANNAQDRSGGIDIQGRKKYYCTEREYSCRRTDP